MESKEIKIDEISPIHSKSNPWESKLLGILRDVKGITPKSMISICINSFEDIENAIKELKSDFRISRMKYELLIKDENTIFEDPVYCKSAMYNTMIIKEAISLIEGIR